MVGKAAERKLPEFKDTDPWDYKAPEGDVQVLDLEPRLFARVEGEGDPNGPAFEAAIAALYGFSYAVRMSYRSDDPPAGCGSYAVGVLQGEWSIAAGETMFDPRRKDRLAWRVMIRQPDFVTPELFERFRREAAVKAVKKGAVAPAWYARLALGRTGAGRFAQTMHRGPYDSEPATFGLMERILAGRSLARSSREHREVYLGDPRRIAPEKLRTILRVALA